MSFDAVLFDMDGLLVDSMRYWIDIDTDIFKQFGVDKSENIITLFTGKSMEENMRWLKENCAIDMSVEELVAERQQKTESIYQTKTQPLLGAKELIEKIYRSSMLQAIASGASEHRIDTIVNRFGWRDFFDGLYSVEHVAHKGKPAPDVFLHAAKELGVSPNRCVVFEDAQNGVVAAKSAGMACVAIPQPDWSFGDFSSADLIVSSLADESILSFLDI